LAARIFGPPSILTAVELGGTVIFRYVALAAFVSLLGSISCLDDEGPGRFTTKDTCYEGERRACQCDSDNEGRGVQFCEPERVFGECFCAGCSSEPDCDECQTCVDRCLCETEHRLDEAACREQCAYLSDGGDAGQTTDAADSPSPPPPAPTTCDPAACAPSPLPVLTACCDPENRCGFAFGETCIASGQEGTIDAACPAVDLFGFLTLPGCCRPDGSCGALEDQIFNFGCFDANALAGGQTVPCEVVR
jgi:hypothetical protein